MSLIRRRRKIKHHETYRILLILLVTANLTAAPNVEVLSELTEHPGNPAVGLDGTVYFSMHPFDAPEYKVMQHTVYTPRL